MDFALVILGVSAAHAAAAISPGPSFVVVARTALAQSRTAGAWSAVGMGLGAVIWACAAVFGLKLLFAAAPWLYTVMKIAGAAYLFYIAVMLWRHAEEPLAMPGSAGAPERARGSALWRGLLTQLSNPKPAVFFGSVFVTLIPADAPALFYAVILPLIFVVETAWYVFVAYAITTRPLRERYRRLKAHIDRGTGAVLAGLGLKLVFDR